jgi:uncharacterized protein YerC
MRVSGTKVNPALEKQIYAMFIQAITDLRDNLETKSFLRDFFNETEYETFVKRLAIAYWLKNKRSYQNIKDNLKVSSATIAMVQSILDKPGIKLILKKVEAEQWANKWAEKIKRFIR